MNKKVIVSTLAISALAVNVFAQGSNLGPVQKVRDGEPLGGGQPASAASVFGAPQGSYRSRL